MIKAIIAWLLIIIGCIILLGAGASIAGYIFHNIRTRNDGSIGWSLFNMPDFTGISLQMPIKTRVFMTDTWAFLVGQIGVALVIVSVGLHLKHLHRQDLGRKQLEQHGIQITEPTAENHGESQNGSIEAHP